MNDIRIGKTTAVVVVALAVAILGTGFAGAVSNFGHEGLGPNATTIEGYIKGSWFVCPNDGIAESITAYVKSTQFKKAKCAIYSYVADNDAGTLIGETEELTISAGYEGWKTFNFSSEPPLSANTKYFLVIFGEETGGISYIYWSATGATNKAIRLYTSYNDFPNPIVGEVGEDMKHRIYCDYTVVAPPLAPGVIIKPPDAKLKLRTHGVYIDFIDDFTAERIIIDSDNVQFDEALLGAGDQITTTIEQTGGDAIIRTLSKDLVELIASDSSGTITEFTMTAFKAPMEVRVYGTPVPKSYKDYYLSTQPNINYEIAMWSFHDEKIAVKFVHTSSVDVAIDFVKETHIIPPIPPIIPSKREFSVVFMSGVRVDNEFGSKTVFTLGENILLRMEVEDSDTGEPIIGAEVIMWYINPATRIMITVPTAELGDGVYDGIIQANEVNVGTFKANVEVKLAGFKTVTDQLTFRVTEAPSPPWPLGFPVAIIAELLLFLFCGIALGLCAVSYRIMLLATAIILVKGFLWDAHFLGGVYPVSVCINFLSVFYVWAGWRLYFKRGVKRVGRVIG